jgi:hypothetical protein
LRLFRSSTGEPSSARFRSHPTASTALATAVQSESSRADAKRPRCSRQASVGGLAAVQVPWSDSLNVERAFSSSSHTRRAAARASSCAACSSPARRLTSTRHVVNAAITPPTAAPIAVARPTMTPSPRSEMAMCTDRPAYARRLSQIPGGLHHRRKDFPQALVWIATRCTGRSACSRVYPTRLEPGGSTTSPLFPSVRLDRFSGGAVPTDGTHISNDMRTNKQLCRLQEVQRCPREDSNLRPAA